MTTPNYHFKGTYGPATISNNAGAPLRSTKVIVYQVGTLVPIQLYTDRLGTATAANPTYTDSNGNLTLYCYPGEVDIYCNNETLTITIYPDPEDDATVPGTTFTGPVYLAGDATQPLQAVTLRQLGGGGGGWPTIDATGPGNLIAQTPGTDSVGYSMTDAGSGGIFLHQSGTGGIGLTVTDPSNGSGIQVTDSGTGGINVSSAGIGGMGFTDSGGGGITIEETSTGALLIQQTDASNTVGIGLTDAGSGGIVLTGTGTGGVGISDTGGGGIALHESSTAPILIEQTDAANNQGIQIIDGGVGGISMQATNGAPVGLYVTGGSGNVSLFAGTAPGGSGNIVLSQQGSGNIQLTTSGTDILINADGGAGGNIFLVGLPTSDPGEPGALYNVSGVVHVSL